MAEYYMQDFETYSKLFREHSLRMVELMRIVDEHLVTELEMASVRPKDLFRMVQELMFEVDRSYKKEKNIEDEPCMLTTYFSKDDVLAEMRTLLREQFQHYLGTQSNGDQ